MANTRIDITTQYGDNIGYFEIGEPLTVETLLSMDAFVGGQTVYYDNFLTPLSAEGKVDLWTNLTNPLSATAGYPELVDEIPYFRNYFTLFPPSDGVTNEGGVMLKIIYLYTTNTWENVITPDTIGNYRPVTYLDMTHVLDNLQNKFGYHHDVSYDTQGCTWEGTHSQEDSGRVNMLNAEDNLFYYNKPINEVDFTEDIDTDSETKIAHLSTIRPYALIPVGDSYILVSIDICAGYTTETAVIYSDENNPANAFNTITAMDGTTQCGVMKQIGIFTGLVNTDSPVDTSSTTLYGYTADGDYGYYLNGSGNGFYMYYAPRNLTSFLELHKIAGCYLLADTVYKPIITDGWVQDISDDLSTPSDLDSFTGEMGHNISDRPQPPHSDNDGIDDMEFDNDVVFSGGMVDYYIITAGGLDSISQGITNNIKYTDVAENIVSLMAYRVNPSRFASGSGVSSVNVGKLNIETPSTPIKITALNPVLTLGSISVQGKYGTLSKPHFLDFAPYTRIDVYVPYCGVIELPSRVMYNTIEVYLLGDVITGNCNAVVKCNGEIVGTKSGVIGRNVPMSYNASAEQHNAMLQGVLNSAAIGTGVMLAGSTGNILGMVAGTMAGVSNIAQQVQAGNRNYTHQIGVTGSIVEGSMPEYCYLRRYSPIDKSDDTYTERYGRPVCKARTLASGDGFTVCDNPVINGSMTLREKNEIESIMKTGIIL